MDIVFIRDLRVSTIIGIYDWERTTKQELAIDLEMAWDIARAAEFDNIEFALDYKAVSKRIFKFVEESEFFLVETLADKIANIVMTEFKVPWLKLTVNKQGAVSIARDVGVIVERGQKT